MLIAFLRTGLRMTALAAGIVASATTLQGAEIVHYSTSGSVDSSGVGGNALIGFAPISSGSVASPSQLSLGEFLVPGEPSGEMTTFTHTPFEINFTVMDVNGVASASSPIHLTGELNGSISGINQSDVIATFNQSNPLEFAFGDHSVSLSVTNPKLSLVPFTSNQGRTTVQAFLVATSAPSVPEPTSISIFLIAAAGFGIQHRLRRR